MNNKREKIAVFLQKGPVVFFGAMISCALWGSAFPFVKTGMRLLELNSQDTPEQILFAGIRFTLAGIFVVILGSLMERRPLVPNGKDYWKIPLLCLFQTVGQYIFYYIGLARSTGVNASIVDSLAYFFTILFACLIFKTEMLTPAKTLGCVLGFAGVVAVNLTGTQAGLSFTFMGEGMIIISAISSGISSSLTKVISKGTDPVMLSGWQFIIGGLVICAVAAVMGAQSLHFTAVSVGILIYLAFVSTIAYTIWTVLIKYNDVSKVSIYGFMMPVFGVLLSAIILGEHQGFHIRYFAALAAISIGIYIVNRAPSTKAESPS